MRFWGNQKLPFSKNLIWTNKHNSLSSVIRKQQFRNLWVFTKTKYWPAKIAS